MAIARQVTVTLSQIIRLYKNPDKLPDEQTGIAWVLRSAGYGYDFGFSNSPDVFRITGGKLYKKKTRVVTEEYWEKV